MLATSYPLWFTLALWALVLIPVYPGVIICVVALNLFLRGREGAGKLALIGIPVLVFGVWVVARNWDSIVSGNPYYLY